MQGKHMIKPALSWPCRFNCHITAATKESVTEMVKQVTAELNEQTMVKRLEQTQ
jgi:putative lipoic acid-binding regulatory protein